MIPAQPPAAANFAAPIHPCAQVYHARLHPWLIIRQLPQIQRLTVCRFRKRNEAEEYLKALKRLSPQATYSILFDPVDLPPTEEPLSEQEEDLTKHRSLDNQDALD